MGKMTLKLYAVLFLGLFSMGAKCQEMALKSNLLYDAFATLNAGVEVKLSGRWTLDVSANYNGWTLSHDRKWKHWLLQPEARYWFCDSFAGHFVGAHVLAGQYNVGNLDNNISFFGSDLSKLSDKRYQGWFAGLGLVYGHAWILNKHWNLEALFGFGWVYTRYDAYPCAHCGTKVVEDKPHNYVGPTKAAINLVYTF